MGGVARIPDARILPHRDNVNFYTGTNHELAAFFNMGYPKLSTLKQISDFKKERIHTFTIPSMYGIFTYIWLIFMVNVGIYTIHGWHGIYHKKSTKCRQIYVIQRILWAWYISYSWVTRL